MGANLTRNENDEIISLDGLFGACFGTHINEERLNYHFKRMRDVVRSGGGAHVQQSGCLPHHVDLLPIFRNNTLNGKVLLPEVCLEWIFTTAPKW